MMNIEKDVERLASQKLMEQVGHTRVTIGASYYGSRRRRKLVAPDSPVVEG